MPHPRPIVFGLAGWMLLCVATALAAPVLIALSPQALLPGDASPPAKPSPEGGVILELPAGSADRAFWDVPIRGLDSAETSIALDLSCDNPAALRAITLHLRSGDSWQSAARTLEGPGRQTLFFHRSDFQSETGNPDWEKTSLLRISLWRGSGAAATILLHSIRLQTPSIAILRGTELTAPGETALAKIGEDGLPDRSGAFAGSDNRDRARLHQRIEAVGAHSRLRACGGDRVPPH